MTRRQSPFRAGEPVWAHRGDQADLELAPATVVEVDRLAQRTTRVVGIRFADRTDAIVPVVACHRESPQLRKYVEAFERWSALQAFRDARCRREGLAVCVQACRETPEGQVCDEARAKLAAARSALFAVHPWGRRAGRRATWDEDA